MKNEELPPNAVYGYCEGEVCQKRKACIIEIRYMTNFYFDFSLISVFVLCDRSKKIFGLIAGVIFGIANIALFIYTKTLYLYIDERFFVDYGFVFGMSAISIFICGWLLNKKVSI